MEQNEHRMRGTEAKQGEVGSVGRSEKRASPLRVFLAQASSDKLDGLQAEESRKDLRHPEERERDRPRGSRTGIACAPLVIRESIMGALRTGQDHRHRFRAPLDGRGKLHLDTLAAQELDTGAAVLATRPIPPEQRVLAEPQGMQHHAHPAGMPGLLAVPLALLALWAGTTVSDTGLIDQAQAAVSLLAPFATPQTLACRTAHGPIGLEGEVLAHKAISFPGATDHW